MVTVAFLLLERLEGKEGSGMTADEAMNLVINASLVVVGVLSIIITMLLTLVVTLTKKTSYPESRTNYK